MRTLARRINEHRARAVDDVSRRNLPASGLKHILHLAARAARDLPDNGKDRSDWNVDVDVRGTVERIEQQAVFSAAEVRRDVDDTGLFLRRQRTESPTMIDCLDDDLVGE